MSIAIRKFEEKDIPYKVNWINDKNNNKYLHYDLPLREDKTLIWYNSIKNRADRADYTITYNGEPAGLIGLINIDQKNKKAEYYICLGEEKYKGKGIAYTATKLLIDIAYYELKLNKIYLYTEIGNRSDQKLFEKVGFEKEGLLKDDLIYNRRKIDRYLYGLNLEKYINKTNVVNSSEIEKFNATPIHKLSEKLKNNNFYIKRDDLFPISFGGNKARKAMLFLEDIILKGCDYVVTYGSSKSNHCRIISNIAASKGIPCSIISPIETSKPNYNSKLIKFFGTEIKYCTISEVEETISKKIKELEYKGYIPYFIQGGGHGNIGTQAYVETYNEIKEYEKNNGLYFDYIFHASGTGTTQSGLICGQLINGDNRKIIGISIARKNPYGRQVVLNSVNDYLVSKGMDYVNFDFINFIDDYVLGGYGIYNYDILQTIKKVLIQDGIPLDTTYTGKAYWGMKEYIKKCQITGKNILFIHTGGTPLFFDDLEELTNE
ncbi:MAG: pyridoxal-phosphate dependent enzyme [Clostridiaceae bacterium]|nr:pyridoxal-phosphate dependent enzyme [Clostridiaceae bacterium]